MGSEGRRRISSFGTSKSLWVGGVARSLAVRAIEPLRYGRWFDVSKLDQAAEFLQAAGLDSALLPVGVDQ